MYLQLGVLDELVQDFGSEEDKQSLAFLRRKAEQSEVLENTIKDVLPIFSEGADIISGIEAKLDNEGIDCLEARDWWNKADIAIAKLSAALPPTSQVGADSGAEGIHAAELIQE